MKNALTKIEFTETRGINAKNELHNLIGFYTGTIRTFNIYALRLIWKISVPNCIKKLYKRFK